jgi:hypothetical protein
MFLRIGRFFKGSLTFEYLDSDDLSLFKVLYIVKNSIVVINKIVKEESPEKNKE